MYNIAKTEYPDNIISEVCGYIKITPRTRKDFFTLLEYLPERERTILVLRYKDKLSHRAIAKLIGISSTRVQQVIATDLRKLDRMYHFDPVIAIENLTEEEKLNLELDRFPQMSRRTYNALMRKDLKTLGDVKEYKDANDYKSKWYIDIRNLGESSVKEIDTLLDKVFNK